MSLAYAWSAEDETIHSIFGNKNDLPVLETDYVIFKIKNELNRISNNGFNSFFDYDYVSLWNVGSSSDFDEFSSLKFKKAIILYGPPGRSKSFSAGNWRKILLLAQSNVINS